VEGRKKKKETARAARWFGRGKAARNSEP